VDYVGSHKSALAIERGRTMVIRFVELQRRPLFDLRCFVKSSIQRVTYERAVELDYIRKPERRRGAR